MEFQNLMDRKFTFISFKSEKKKYFSYRDKLIFPESDITISEKKIYI